jgi:hypothetical protein
MKSPRDCYNLTNLGINIILNSNLQYHSSFKTIYYVHFYKIAGIPQTVIDMSVLSIIFYILHFQVLKICHHVCMSHDFEIQEIIT